MSEVTLVSFRHHLLEQVTGFLGEEQLNCGGTAEALVELVTSLSHYQEEGTALFPVAFLCEDLTRLLQAVQGHEALCIGSGAREAETVRRALKQCAPLARESWSIWFERNPQGGLRYGLFRTDAFVLHETPMERLRASTDVTLRAVGVVQLGDNIIELRGGSGAGRYVYLSGARSDAPPSTVVFRGLLSAIVRDVAPALRPETWTFYRRVFVDVMRSGRGSLVAVLPAGTEVPALFDDGLVLSPALDVAADIAAYRSGHAEADRARVHGRSRLLAAMLGVDGITLLRSDGSIAGYQVFIQHPPASRPSGLIGGARRRTYGLLAGAVGRELVAAFYRSQDGAMECASVA